MRLDQRLAGLLAFQLWWFNFILNEKDIDDLFINIDIIFVKNWVLEYWLVFFKHFGVLLKLSDKDIVWLVDCIVVWYKFDELMVKLWQLLVETQLVETL